jgi:hypothetical protein
VAQQADALGVDARVRAQPRHAREHVAEHVVVGGERVVAAAAAHAAVVDAQHGVAGTGEVVGDHQEGLVAEDLLVAVLGAAAGDQQQRGDARVAGRQGERAGEGDVAAGVRDLLLEVGEGRLRLLRPRDAPASGSRRAPGGTAAAGRTLREGALDDGRRPRRPRRPGRRGRRA